VPGFIFASRLTAVPKLATTKPDLQLPVCPSGQTHDNEAISPCQQYGQNLGIMTKKAAFRAFCEGFFQGKDARCKPRKGLQKAKKHYLAPASTIKML
jgi:hypothetical protein